METVYFSLSPLLFCKLRLRDWRSHIFLYSAASTVNKLCSGKKSLELQPSGPMNKGKNDAGVMDRKL